MSQPKQAVHCNSTVVSAHRHRAACNAGGTLFLLGEAHSSLAAAWPRGGRGSARCVKHASCQPRDQHIPLTRGRRCLRGAFIFYSVDPSCSRRRINSSMLRQPLRKVGSLRIWWPATLCPFARPVLVVLLLSIWLQRKSICQEE